MPFSTHELMLISQLMTPGRIRQCLSLTPALVPDADTGEMRYVFSCFRGGFALPNGEISADDTKHILRQLATITGMPLEICVRRLADPVARPDLYPDELSAYDVNQILKQIKTTKIRPPSDISDEEAPPPHDTDIRLFREQTLS